MSWIELEVGRRNIYSQPKISISIRKGKGRSRIGRIGFNKPFSKKYLIGKHRCKVFYKKEEKKKKVTIGLKFLKKDDGNSYKITRAGVTHKAHSLIITKLLKKLNFPLEYEVYEVLNPVFEKGMLILRLDWSKLKEVSN